MIYCPVTNGKQVRERNQSTKHKKQKGEICKLYLPTTIDLLQHVKEEHKKKYVASHLSSVENEERRKW